MREPEPFTLILAPAAIASIAVEWSGAERMLARVRGMVGVTAGTNPAMADPLARVVYNLPLLLAFEALRGALIAARDTGYFACGSDYPGPLMDAARDALPWLDWQALRDGLRRRNRVAHDGDLYGADQCIADVQCVEAQRGYPIVCVWPARGIGDQRTTAGSRSGNMIANWA